MPVPNHRNSLWKAQQCGEVIRLRSQGYTFREIADQTGVSYPTAWRWCCQEIERHNERTRANVEAMIRVEFELTEVMLEAVLEPAASGDIKAVNACLKILERRAKYLGLDATENHNVEVEKIPNREKFDAELQAIIEELEEKTRQAEMPRVLGLARTA